MKKIQRPASRHLPCHSRLVLLIMIMLFSTALWSQDEPEPAPEAPEAGIERPMISTGVDAAAIARKRPDTAVWLTDSEQSRVLALFQPELDTPAQGALLILADEGVSSASGIADALRMPLSESGWAVMTMGLPQPPFAVQQWLTQQNNRSAGVGMAAEGAADDDANAESADNSGAGAMITVMEVESPNEALDQYRSQVILALNAGVDALSEREYRRIVLVGVGRAAGHVTRQVREDGRASNLVWIAPNFYADESAGLTELLAAAASPSILELYSTLPGEKTADRSARERAAAMERAGITGYRRQPVAMARQPQPREARALANRIEAWLRSDSASR